MPIDFEAAGLRPWSSPVLPFRSKQDTRSAKRESDSDKNGNHLHRFIVYQPVRSFNGKSLLH
ncbi:MAG: hypothetical protein AAF514_07930 [Verrucomicrobiota bacterium]